jgi:hypothetical protein
VKWWVGSVTAGVGPDWSIGEVLSQASMVAGMNVATVSAAE